LSLLRFEVQIEAALPGAGLGRDVVDGRPAIAKPTELEQAKRECRQGFHFA